jgi:hypothetical protein
MNHLPSQSPLSPTRRGGDEDTAYEEADDATAPQRPRMGVVTLGRKNVTVPLVPTSTGTRYGRGLTGVGGTNRQRGGGTPVCAKCGKLVYFAEQVSEKKDFRQMLILLRRRKQSGKRSTRGVFAALSATLGWIQDGYLKERHGLIVTGAIQRCGAFLPPSREIKYL